MSSHTFNANHERRLVTTFRYVDDLLSQAVARLDAASTPSGLSEYVPDAQPVQHKVATDYLDRLRGLMRAFLDSHGIPLPGRRTSALWAASTACLFASVSFEELRGNYMRGYGTLSADAEHELEALVSGFSDVLRRLSGYLSQTPDQDMCARIERLEQPHSEIEVLRNIDRIITSHGLVEFRGNLAMLVERLESPGCEIAVFGRVSSGKSSLLNYLIGTDVLPVGVTPITAVPIRIVHGATSRAVIEFAELAPIIIEPHDLASYAAESGNPANAKHVARIQVELSSPLLEQGATFVDTPGLGSMALSGAKETAAYIPRCDLGIVLIDAASSLTPDDVVLLDTLRRCGAAATVLLTKADLLERADRERIVDYVRRELQRNLGTEVAVQAISVKESFSELCDRWVDEVLGSLLQEQRALNAESMHRKLDRLRRSVGTALEHRLSRGSGLERRPQPNWTRLEEELSEGMAQLDAARLAVADMRSQIDTLAQEVIEDTARRVVQQWHDSGNRADDGTDCLSESLVESASRLSTKAAESLQQLQARLTAALSKAAEITRLGMAESDWLPRISGLPWPLFPSEQLRVGLRRPVVRLLGRSAEIAAVRGRLRHDMLGKVARLLNDYAKQLEAWWQQAIGELRGTYAIQADLYRAKSQPDLAFQPGGVKTDDAAIRSDLRWLNVEATDVEDRRASSLSSS
jgi:GTP-binding protein EngB required for normal cell division